MRLLLLKQEAGEFASLGCREHRFANMRPQRYVIDGETPPPEQVLRRRSAVGLRLRTRRFLFAASRKQILWDR